MKMTHEMDFGRQVRESGAYFLEGLKELQKRHKSIGDVDGLGLALRAEICKQDGYTRDKTMMDWIAEQGMKGDLKVAGKKYGLVLDVGGYHKNVITFSPSLLITKEEIDLAFNLLDQLFTRAKKH